MNGIITTAKMNANQSRVFTLKKAIEVYVLNVFKQIVTLQIKVILLFTTFEISFFINRSVTSARKGRNKHDNTLKIAIQSIVCLLITSL